MLERLRAAGSRALAEEVLQQDLDQIDRLDVPAATKLEMIRRVMALHEQAQREQQETDQPPAQQRKGA